MDGNHKQTSRANFVNSMWCIQNLAMFSYLVKSQLNSNMNFVARFFPNVVMPIRNCHCFFQPEVLILLPWGELLLAPTKRVNTARNILDHLENYPWSKL